MRHIVAFLAALVVLSGGATVAPVDAAAAEEDALSRIEAQARELTEHGARSEAVYMLQRALETYRESPDRQRIEADIRRFTLEGRPAPHLQTGVAIGTRVPTMKELDGKVVLLFFWAHWCADCKAESSMVAELVDKYRARGLVLVAPTQRYGYVSGGRPASPDKELRYIVQTRDTSYAFMRKESVPVTDANYRQYGVASIPMHVLIDRTGIIRLYQPGRITTEELDGAIRKVLAG
jgi:thiol-disulfide isomerase/thioredoxin